MKKLLLSVLMLCLFLSPALAETDGDFVYSVIDGRAEITAYTGSAEQLSVPGTLGGYPVAAIRYCAFRNCTQLTAVTLPNGLVSIGSNAFQGCASLSRIDLPDSLTAIGTHAFYGCANLTQIALPDSLKRLHPYAFYGCSAVRLCSLDGQAACVLTDYGNTFTSPDFPQLALYAYERDGLRTLTVADCAQDAAAVSFPDGVTLIDDYAFFGCASLTEIEIPEGVTEIGYSAFEGCASLKQVALPASVETIAENAFARCPQVTILAPEGSAAHRFAEANANLIWSAP